MKKVITKSLCIICLVGMLVTLTLNISIQVVHEIKDFERVSGEYFHQIENLLADNDKKLEQVKAEFAKTCIVRARAAAYIAYTNPEILEDAESAKQIASLLQVDEVHAFNASGIIYAGTNPEYYGISVSSGEQVSFFAAMLEDHSLELCQDMTPNTAEEKMMQYAAVWCPDNKKFIQVGLTPERVLEAEEGNNISDLFAMISCESASNFIAVDEETNVIVGSTDKSQEGKTASQIGLTIDGVTEEGLTCGYQGVNEKKQYCVMKRAGNLILVHMSPSCDIFSELPMDLFLLCTYIISLFFVLLVATYIFLDRKIICSIVNINKQLKKIEQGNYEVKLSDDSTKEFAELCHSINSMTGSLLNFPGKISRALELSEVPIAICEYEPAKKKMTATSRAQDILALTDEECEEIRRYPECAEQNVRRLLCRAEGVGAHVFRLRKAPERFVKIEVFEQQGSNMVVLIDVTNDAQEKYRLAEERDTDVLTGLYNRRAFFREMDRLFAEPETRKKAVLLAFDLDKLKVINDVYGHVNGDRYLRTFGEALGKCITGPKVAARIGGDEFALFAYDIAEEPEKLVKRLLACRDVKTVILENGEEKPLEFSMGWVFCSQEDTDYIHLLDEADRLMYEDKAKRRKKAEEKSDEKRN